MIPTVHMNGTSLGELIRGWDSVAEAADVLVAKIRSLEFNARDYYPQGDGAWLAAAEEMKAHVEAIHRMHAAAGEIMEALYCIEDERKARGGSK